MNDMKSAVDHWGGEPLDMIESILKRNIKAPVESCDAINFMYDDVLKVKLVKLTSQMPPPLYDTSEHFGSADGMIVFLNEELEDYFEDVTITDKREKCRLLLKCFGDKGLEYKLTIKRFYEQPIAKRLVDQKDVLMTEIYREIVYYIFARRPRANVKMRAINESLTNYLHRWFNRLDYCGVSAEAQGAKILRKVFENPNLLNCDEALVRELKDRYYMRQFTKETITMNEVLGFAQRLDVLFARRNSLGMQTIASTIDMSCSSQRTEHSYAEQKGSEQLHNSTQKNEIELNMHSPEMKKGQIDSIYYEPIDKRPPEQIYCYTCGKPGHISRFCKAKRTQTIEDDSDHNKSIYRNMRTVTVSKN